MHNYGYLTDNVEKNLHNYTYIKELQFRIKIIINSMRIIYYLFLY